MRFSKSSSWIQISSLLQCPCLLSSLVLLFICYKASHNLAHKTSNSKAALSFLLLVFECPLSYAGLTH